jgi:hypothetical protein
MATASIAIQGTVAGVSFGATSSRTASGVIGQEVTLNAGAAGVVANRTDNDTTDVTLSGGHGQTNGTYDIFWTGGIRRGMTGTVASDTLSLDGGAGDNLPADTTAVVVCKQTSIDIDVVGDNVQALIVQASKRASVDFQEAGPASIVAFDIPEAEAVAWINETTETSAPAYTNPLGGKTVVSAAASSGSTTAATLKIGVLYNSV